MDSADEVERTPHTLL